MKYLLFIALLLMSANASSQSARFGSSMISIGDPVARLRDVAGAPEKVEPADAEREVWTYRRKGRFIQMWIAGGKVERVVDRKAEVEGA